MTSRARLRVELPDRPGALGRLAGIIGELGGNVVSVDVQHVAEGALAIDELVVDLPDGVDGGTLLTVLGSHDAGRLLSVQAALPHQDVVLRALEWVESLLELGPDGRDGAIVGALTDLCSAPGTWLGTTADAAAHEAGRLALERGAPVAAKADDLPAALAEELGAGAWLLAVPDDREDPRRVAFLPRPAHLRFTTTEIGRVSALLRTCRHLEDLTGVAGG